MIQTHEYCYRPAPMQATKPQCWQDGNQLVVERDGELPSVCVRCGQPGVERISRRVSWSSPWLLLLILLGVIFYVLIASIAAKRSRVTIWLCASHANLRRRDVRIGWIGLGLLTLSLMALAFGNSIVPRTAAGFLGTLELVFLLASIVLAFYGYSRSRLVRASRIDDLYVRLNGVSPLLRTSLPLFTS